MRFAMEILQEVRASLGKDFPITCRLCGDEYLAGGFDITQSKYVARKLEEKGIDAIDVSAGTHETGHIISAPSQISPGFLTHLSKAIKEVVQIPVGGTPAVTSRGMGEDAMKRIARLIGRTLANLEENESEKAAIRKEVTALAAEYPLYPDLQDAEAGIETGVQVEAGPGS